MATERPGTSSSNTEIGSLEYVTQKENEVFFREGQAEFFELSPDKRLKVDFGKIASLPECVACEPVFTRGARKFYSSEMEELRGFVYQWLRVFFEKSRTTMWRSSMYGTKTGAEALAALANRLGFPAHVENPYGNAEMDFAVVVDCSENK